MGQNAVLAGVVAWALLWASVAFCRTGSAELPRGVQAVWDLETAHRETTATRERVCLNGLWRWQPTDEGATEVPADGWGHFKVPGSWPGITSYNQKDCQTLFAHPDWQDTDPGGVQAAWYQREFTVPADWNGRRIVLRAEYVNSFAAVYVDGRHAGDIRFPSGEVDLTPLCRPGETHRLSLMVVAMPLKGVMMSYSDTASAREVKGRVARRGLCGDVYLVGTPKGPRIADVKIDTSVRRWQITFDAELVGLDEGAEYALRARVTRDGAPVEKFTSEPFAAADLERGRLAFARGWRPDGLWDVHTPQNTCRLALSLLDSSGRGLDRARPVRFGFREFWIDGRDFYLNGTRIFLSSVPLDNALVGAAWANYEAARESMERLQSFGINFVYTHNYGCRPGSHLGYAEVLRAADDVGMLVAFSQPHFGHYDWDSPDAEATNGYARHAEFYVRAAQNHPSVVAYSMSHNATGYAEDMNPDLIDGVHAERNRWAANNVRRARRAEAIVRRLDPSRIVYHHSSGNLGPMHTSNFYANWAPIQEMSDWFEHWATEGVKPVFLCEYGVPLAWDWTMYRGWYEGERTYGGAKVPWQFCLAEWNAQFYGDRAFRISEMEKRNLRWEAKQYRAGRTWHRWDYPVEVNSAEFEERDEVYARYFADNWRAFRTWGVSAFGPWNHGMQWRLREGVDTGRRKLEVDWQNLQRPGLSADYVDDRYERMDLAYERSDWTPTAGGRALIRNNKPRLAYLAGEPGAFTGKDHNFYPDQTVEKQIVVVNNSRVEETARCTWSFGLPKRVTGNGEVAVPTGERERVPLRFELPADLPPGTYVLKAEVRFGSGETQRDSFTVHVLPRPEEVPTDAAVALFDPLGQTAELLDRTGVAYQRVDADADPSGFDVLVVGKSALTVEGPGPDLGAVREGLNVIVFEQTGQVLEQRLGFRRAEYGLRRPFKRVPDHPLLDGLDEEHLRNWRGEATVLPPRLDYEPSGRFAGAPTVRWCGIPVTRLWRCGNRGNVASALIEKPARGDFLPVLDGGYSLQYSPLIEHRAGRGMVLFCQVDVTGRTEIDPAADVLAHNILRYVFAWQPPARRQVVYAGSAAGRAHLEAAGFSPADYAGGAPEPDQVLVVGPGGGDELSAHADALAGWLAEGGRVVAIGLDEAGANAFLPSRVEMEDREHIAAWFDRRGAGSPLAGIGPADVHNRQVRNLPLVRGGARPVGDGVLAVAEGGKVVFWQLPPWRVDLGNNSFKRTYRRASALTTRLLANMGAATSTPLLERFGSPPAETAGPSLLEGGDFGSDADGDGVADDWSVSAGAGVVAERERLGDGWCQVVGAAPPEGDERPTVMLSQRGAPVEEGRWYRISFKARAEGVRARVAVTVMNTATWSPLFDYARFSPGGQWQEFSFDVRAGETVRGTTRFQVWWRGGGRLWLSGLEFRPIGAPTEGRWLEGLYLDEPEEWDDPYRFFRW